MPSTSASRTVPTGTHFAATVLIALGGIAAATAAVGWCPLLPLARVASSDGSLSEPFVRRLLDRQMWSGASLLLAAGILAIAGGTVTRGLRSFVHSESRRGTLLIAGISLVMTLGVQWILFRNLPHVTDAISHSFQSRVFAEGHLTAPLPPCYPSFHQPHMAMTADGRWFTKYTPGHSLLLTIGQLVGAPGLIVPIAQFLCVLAFAALCARFLPPPLPRIATLLYALSPLAILLGASFMSHSTHLAFTLAGFSAMIRAYDAAARRTMFALTAGFLLAFSAIIRPQDAFLALALGGFAWLLSGAWRGARFWSVVLRMLPGAALPAGLWVAWNIAVYGQPLTIGYGFEQRGFLYPMFQSTYGFGEHFPIAKAIAQAASTLARFDEVALGWPTTFAAFALLIFALPLRRSDMVCAAAVIGVILFYLPYNYLGLEYEARYMFPALPAAVILIARGGTGFVAWLRPRVRIEGAPASLANGLLLAAFLYAAIAYWPRQIVPRYGSQYESVVPDLHRRTLAAVRTPALVLLPSDGANLFRFSTGMIFNDPWLRGDVVYARDPGSNVTCLSSAFADRNLYRYEPDPAWTGGIWRLVRPATALNPRTGT